MGRVFFKSTAVSYRYYFWKVPPYRYSVRYFLMIQLSRQRIVKFVWKKKFLVTKITTNQDYKQHFYLWKICISKWSHLAPLDFNMSFPTKNTCSTTALKGSATLYQIKRSFSTSFWKLKVRRTNLPLRLSIAETSKNFYCTMSRQVVLLV